MRKLNLDILQEGLLGITPVMGAFYMEAAIIGLIKSGFDSGVTLNLSGAFDEVFQITWSAKLTPAQINSWKEEQHYHSAGAVGIALLLAQTLLEYTVFEEGTIGTGIDYWLGKDINVESNNSFSKKLARLEISGIGKASKRNSINMRVNKKKKQITASDSTKLDGWICIVEFSKPTSKLIKK